MGGSLFPVRVNDRYGYIDQRGKLVIKPQFIDAREFSEGLARVWVAGGKGRWGYVDLTGKMAIPAQFEWAEDFSEGLAVVKIDGKKVPYPYYSTWDFQKPFLFLIFFY